MDIHQVTNILKTIQGHPELKSFHNFRSRTSGGINFIEAHLVFDSNISLINAHRISHEIEDAIRESDTQSSWSILFHLDPYNDEEEDKKR